MLANIVLPENITFIGSSCFHSCSNLKCFVLPSKIELISDNLFYNCLSLQYIQILSNNTIIHTYSFYNINQNAIICYEGECFINNSLSFGNSSPKIYVKNDYHFDTFGGLKVESSICPCIFPCNILSCSIPNKPTNHHLTTLQIVLITVGSLLFVVILIILFYLFKKQKLKCNKISKENEPMINSALLTTTDRQ
jgi:hypothetical protein